MPDDSRIIVRDNHNFHKSFHALRPDSVVCCRLRLSAGEELILADLLHRGVTVIPSVSAQLASRSKVYQARTLSEFMPRHTLAIYDANGLLEATSLYRRHGIGEVVVKRDRKNGGAGIHRFHDIEDVYNQAAFGSLAFPLVIQPFLDDFIDLRLIFLGDYMEGYQRNNPWNFRHNLHCGGTSSPFEPKERVVRFCRQVMARGDFPYAHLDLMVAADESLYLSEINLRGGLRGARIEARDYMHRLDQLHRHLLEDHLASTG